MTPGTQLGPYKILSPIGAGGMGEVYKARDTRLNRDVAIKVLPAALANDSDYLLRFQREAQALAALQHPNIATIYGLEQHAIVMELVEGKTLQGPLPVNEALPIARQIADALEAAHDRGIVHRDLKPGNILLTADGTVKVLDFGLAKAVETTAGANPADSPTLTLRATEAGLILGTAAYMSPEQAAGKPVDRRADIWSFGVVLYELLTGKQLFDGETVSHTLADVLKGPIDLSAIPEGPIRDLIQRCLDRNPKTRLRDIGEARITLSNPRAAAETAPSASSPRLMWAAIALLVATSAVAGYGWWRAAQPADRPLVQLEVAFGDVSFGNAADLVLSPDGSRIVFVSKARLFTRRLSQPAAVELEGTEGASAPFFSPDGQFVAFFAAGKLRKIPVDGGAVVDLAEAAGRRGGTWGSNHVIVASLGLKGGLFELPDTGGEPKPLSELADDEVIHRWPQFLPGGKTVLFTSSRYSGGFLGFDNASTAIHAFSLAGHRRKKILSGASFARYVPGPGGPGFLLYVSRGRVFAVAFDPDALEVIGTPVPVIPEIGMNTANGAAYFDVARDGTLVYRRRAASSPSALQWVDTQGSATSLPAKAGLYTQPHLSPDGNQVVLTVSTDEGSALWTYDWKRDVMAKVTGGSGIFTFPVWSPDGRFIVFHTDAGISWMLANGGGKPETLLETNGGLFPWSFSPDGKRLAYAQFDSGTGDIWTVPIEVVGDRLRPGKPEPYVRTADNELYPAFSPDGRFVAYRFVEGGRTNIVVRSFPDTGAKWQISNGNATFPIWSPNRRELFFRTEDNQLMVVDYTVKGDTFQPGKPRPLAQIKLADTGFYQNLDISPDGKRFLALAPVEPSSRPPSNSQVTFLFNFSHELRRRLSPGK